ncbi:beta-N-acetylhexosaminidase [Paenibacillus dokdonensis]|uniref:beta-N-acetylhexosaminidase n=1 Tax=Paenibacillus dokdonensis TaxID=2567944 RepID=A0ABU6GRM4_9BACL|nr:beta-N-acetylhexosaminidase [Paenibacillus dokdonensis]MEC0242376.1 beta-N-acetylhexosaminidase [Paenibacillus dokdonensis]
MKRIWQISMTLMLAGILTAGCGGGNNEANPSEPQTGKSSNQNTNQGSNSPVNSGESDTSSGTKETDPGDVNKVPSDPALEQLNKMSTEEKIGQLVLVGMDGTTSSAATKELLEKYHVGGFIFYKNNIENTKQALKLFNDLKQENKSNPVPLWMSVDEEGGRVSRMPKDFVKIPTSQAIGKKDSAELSKEIGGILGRELSGFGLNMDFAPVLDINSNPQNPVIGDRSFGNKADLVSRLGLATMEGIKGEKVVPVVKHFPGHGDTSVDSHIGLPVVNHDLTRLRKMELVPFKDAIGDKADVVMIAHLLMPKIDPDHPASFSKKVITDLLRNELGFQGVVISDDMTMGAIEENYDIGKASVSAILAGGNIILVGHDYDKEKIAIHALKNAVNDGTISEDVLNNRVYAILKLKHSYGLSDKSAAGPDVQSINADLKRLLKKYGLQK